MFAKLSKLHMTHSRVTNVYQTKIRFLTEDIEKKLYVDDKPR